MPIVEKQDLSKGGGDTLNFTVGSELVGDGKKGSNTLIGYEEKLNLYTYQLLVDFQRHAVATDKRLKSFSAAQRRLTLTQMVSRWCGRHKQWEALLSLVKNGAFSASGIANNLFWPGGVSADASLTTSNVLDTSVFDNARQKLVGLGAKPANISRDEGEEVPFFIMLATTNALAHLRDDDAWVNAQLHARPREGSSDMKNPLFTGAFSGKTYGGILPFEVPNPDHDNPKNGAIGNPLEPRALLRSDWSASVGAETELLGGGSGATSTAALYFRDFPGYDYLFTSGQTPAADSGTYYLKIKNLPGSTDAGMFEICSYTGSTNNGNKLAVITRNVAGTTSLRHDAGSLIVPCNVNGVEIANVLFLGAWALLRGYGEYREMLEEDKQDYGFKNGVAVESIFGQAPARRADGKMPNFALARVSL